MLSTRLWRSSELRLTLGIWLFFASLYSLSSSGRFFSVDEVAAFQVTRYLAWWDGRPVAPSIVTAPDSQGRYWGTNGPALSVLALPFYAVGTLLEQVLPDPWQRALAGELMANSAGVVWGGDLHIFTVSFFNSFVTATLLSVFFALCRRLGNTRQSSLVSVCVLGLATLIGGHAKNFFTHGLVALNLLAAVVCLVHVRQTRQRWLPSLAGVFAGGLILTRPVSAVILPWLVAYTAFASDRDTQRLKRVSLFVGPIGVAMLSVLLFNWYRFGNPFDLGYGHTAGFETPLFDTSILVGLYGQLFSVGRSIFLYSPPLLLAVVMWPRFVRKHREERALNFMVVGITLTFLVLYAVWFNWWGGWSFGNRFLLPVVPLLMLAFPEVVERLSQERNLILLSATGVLLTCGFVIQVLGVSIHISMAYHAYQLADYSCLFIPEKSHLAAHWDALRHGLYLDFWLVRVVEQLGFGPACGAATPGLIMMILGGWLVGSGTTSEAPD